MRILMVQRFDLQTVSCAERIWRQAEQLARWGHDVTLIDYPHHQRQQQYPILRPAAPPGVRLIDFDRRGSALMANTRRLIRLAREADVLHLWKCYPDTGLPVLWTHRLTGIPWHYDWDDWEGGGQGIARQLTGSRLIGRLVGHWERRLPRWAGAVSVASAGLRRHCQRWGRPGLPIVDAPVGADLELFAPITDVQRRRAVRMTVLGGLPPEVPVVVYAGQLEVANYPELALEALARLPGRLGAQLYIIGDGPRRAGLEQRAESLGVAPHVTFTGYLPRQQVASILSVADLGLAPLDDTPVMHCKSPLKIAEYLASGLPVVASDIGEAGRMIGEAGRCVPVGQGAEGFAAALLDLLLHPDKAALRATARDRIVLHYNWETSTRTLEGAYAGLVG